MDMRRPPGVEPEGWPLHADAVVHPEYPLATAERALRRGGIDAEGER
ncbi:hypothetical protein [Halomarina ordinaria]|uniref:Uncharacterized protein n=1 Tax=Halomarina ordinaria TaxID=3033939 RepID=A0ABD5U8F8_9EURY|nr:hypothetical protein [Halomarina sp. PSRA2]